MTETVEIPIREWMQLPEVLSLEDYYQNEGLLNHSWKDFEVVDSTKAYETYKDTQETLVDTGQAIINSAYSLLDITHNKGKADELLLRAMTGTLFALRIAAENTKLEGYPVFKGKLIVQARTAIQIDDTSDTADGGTARRVYWRGSVFKIGETHELH